MKVQAKMWAIQGQWNERSRPFLYVGTRYTRRDMIMEHIGDKGRTWEDCLAVGDKIVKVLVTVERRRTPSKKNQTKPSLSL